jgi:hypothetical protein
MLTHLGCVPCTGMADNHFVYHIQRVLEVGTMSSPSIIITLPAYFHATIIILFTEMRLLLMMSITV